MSMLIDVTGKKSIIPGINKIPPVIGYNATESVVRNLMNHRNKWNVYCSITKRLITPDNIDEFMNDKCCGGPGGGVDTSSNGNTKSVIIIDIEGAKKNIPIINKLPPVQGYSADEAFVRRLVALPEWRVYSSLSGRLITNENIDEMLGTKCSGGSSSGGGGSSSGGTTVVANPPDGSSSTNVLRSIKIGNDIFKIESDAALESRISALEEDIADITYEQIVIESFTNNQSVVEMGSTISSVVLSWTLNKNPKTQNIDGVTIGNTIRSKTLTNLKITSTTQFVLTVTDERNTTKTATTEVSCMNGVYYGTGINQTSYSDSFIIGLEEKSLQTSLKKTFTINAGVNRYIYYCIPTRYGTPTFKVGGFSGGFTKQSTIQFTNPSGYTESYDIWRTDNPGLGLTEIIVS